MKKYSNFRIIAEITKESPDHMKEQFPIGTLVAMVDRKTILRFLFIKLKEHVETLTLIKVPLEEPMAVSRIWGIIAVYYGKM